MILLDKIDSREAVIGVIGLGYVGLPLAVVFAEAGFKVVGFDIDSHKVESINRGESYIEDVPSKTLRALVEPPIASLNATTDFSVLKHCDAVSICVPTPFRNRKLLAG